MQKFIDRWQIQSYWQLIFPILGILSLLFSGYLIGKSILKSFDITAIDSTYLGLISALTIFFAVLFLIITLKLFKALEHRWEVTYRWELIAIFLAFAVTGSSSARLSDPILSLIGITKESTPGLLYWPLRIFLIFPVYQVLLVIVGWLFGQFKFFWNFEKKILRRIGLGRFLKD